MTMAIVAGVVAFLVVAVVLSRQSSKTKKRAIADLEAEKEDVGAFDIFELVESEVRALDLTSIEGALDIPHGVLLKIWSDSGDVVESCIDRANLRYVVKAGIDPQDATDDDVTLKCTQPKMDDE
jgi:hypothetical protein